MWGILGVVWVYNTLENQKHFKCKSFVIPLKDDKPNRNTMPCKKAI